MSRIPEAFCLAIVLLAIAGLAVFDVIPEQIAQYAPLAVVPFVIARRNCACTLRKA